MFDVADYGALPDGTTKNTDAFARAIADAAAAGGGVVDVPAGTWLTGPIHLASGIELHLEPGATILFSQTFADYLPPVPTRWEGLDVLNWSPFIYALDCTDVALTGAGTLNGQGAAWASWKMPSVQEAQRIYDFYLARLPLDPASLPAPPTSAVNPGLRPAFVEFNGCTNVLVDGPSITGSPYWTLHPLYSRNVIIRNVHVDTTATASNGDGFVPDSCTNVLVEQSSFATSDDCIAIKSGLNEDGIAVGKPSRNIVVRDITTTAGHGGVAIGSETSGGVGNVYVTSSSLLGLGQPIRVKTLPGRGGTIAGLWFGGDLTLGWSVTALEITTRYAASTIPPHDPSLLPTLAGVSLSGLTGTGAGPVYTITGPLSGLAFDGVTLSGSPGTCTQAPGTTLARTTLPGVDAGATTLPCN
jgi:polygalacturonase